MRTLTCRTFVVLAGILSACGARPIGHCSPAGSEDDPIAATRVNTIMGTQGPFQFRLASYGRECVGDFAGSIRPANRNAHGLMDASGDDVLVPAKYSLVLPISETTAIVWRNDDERGMMYEFGRGETGPAPFEGSGRLMGTNTELSTPVAGSPTLNIYLGRGEIRQINNIGDCRQYSDYVVADFTTDDGAEVSIVFDASMRQARSPVVGRVETWRMAVGGRTTDVRGMQGAPVDLASRMIEVSHPDLPYGQLYFPLLPDGRPASLPEGAIGVLPMKVADHLPPGSGDLLSLETAFGWAIVYPTDDGLEIAPVAATLEEALRRGPSAPRLSAWRQDGYLYFGRDLAGRWRVFGNGFVNVEQAIASGPGFGSPEEAEFARIAAIREAGRQRRLADEERERELIEHRRQEGLREWARIQAGGRLCGPNTRPGILPPEGLERYFRECEVDPNFIRNLGPGVSAEARAVAERRANTAAEEYQRARAEAEHERFFGGPQSQGDPWAQGLAAAEAAARSSHNAFMQRAQQTYMTNLRAWNSGAQNWYSSRP